MKTPIALLAIFLASIGLVYVNVGLRQKIAALDQQQIEATSTQAAIFPGMTPSVTKKETQAVVKQKSITPIVQAVTEQATTTEPATLSKEVPTIFTLANGAKVDINGVPQSGIDYFKVKNTCIGAPSDQYNDCVSYSINLPPSIDPIVYYDEHKTCVGLQNNQLNTCLTYALNLPQPLTPEQYYAQQDANATPTLPAVPTPGRVDAKGNPLSGPDWYKIYKTCIGSPAYQALGCELYQKSLQI